MIGKDSREDMDGYGVLPWIGGIALGAAVIGMMFFFSHPIS